MDQPSFTYELFIADTPEKVWEALTNPDLTLQYWGHRNVSDWKVGSTWEHQRPDDNHFADIAGNIIAAEPSKRLVHSWTFAGTRHRALVTFDIERVNSASTRLTLTHENIQHDAERHMWAKVLCGLKTLLETGRPTPFLV